MDHTCPQCGDTCDRLAYDGWEGCDHCPEDDERYDLED